MADEIHVFSSTHTYAPVLTGETGKLVDLLTAVLVDGYTAQSVASITRSGTTATVTVSGGHGLVSGQWATIAGADQGDYNGRFQVTVSSSTVFTYTVANSPTTPATGTITARRASAGWNLEFSGTNKAAYRSPNNASQRHLLRVLDDASLGGGAKEASWRGYVSMSDVDTGSEPFPTSAQASAGLYVQKSTTANSTARGWLVFANDKTFYLIVSNGSTTLVYGFGHFNSRKAGDGYNTFIAAAPSSNTTTGSGAGTGVMCGVNLNHDATYNSTSGTLYVPRITAQTGTSSRHATYSLGAAQTGDYVNMHGFKSSNQGNGFAVPSANADGGLYIVPLLLLELASSQNHIIRGALPGVYANACGQASVSSGTTSTGVVELPGRSLYHQDTSSVQAIGGGTGQLLFDSTGPW